MKSRKGIKNFLNFMIMKSFFNLLFSNNNRSIKYLETEKLLLMKKLEFTQNSIG